MASNTSAYLLQSVLPIIRIGTPSIVYKSLPPPTLLRPIIHGGFGLITGSVKESGVPENPVARRVRLHKKLDGLLVRDTWSKEDGSYEFRGVEIQEYYVIAYDHTGNYNAVIKDSITPDIFTP